MVGHLSQLDGKKLLALDKGAKWILQPKKNLIF